MGFIHVRRAGFIPSTVPYLMLYLHRLYIYYSTLTLLQNRWFWAVPYCNELKNQSVIFGSAQTWASWKLIPLISHDKAGLSLSLHDSSSSRTCKISATASWVLHAVSKENATLDSIKKWQWEVIYRMGTGLEAPMPSSEERSGRLASLSFILRAAIPDPKKASQFFCHFGTSVPYQESLAPISLPRMDRHRSTHWPAKNPYFQMRDGSAANEMIIQKDTKVASEMKCEARILAL